MYFRLDCELNRNAGLIMKKGNLSALLLDGKSVKADTLKLPWPLLLKHTRPDPLQMADFYSSVNVMSQRLVDALQSAGVDNLQLFDADIVRKDTGEKLGGYRVVNILGLVSAADSRASKGRPLANKTFFETLVLDETRARGHLMFRLAESLNDIIIAEKVAKRVADGGFVDVTVEPLGPAK